MESENSNRVSAKLGEAFKKRTSPHGLSSLFRTISYNGFNINLTNISASDQSLFLVGQFSVLIIYHSGLFSGSLDTVHSAIYY